MATAADLLMTSWQQLSEMLGDGRRRVLLVSLFLRVEVSPSGCWLWTGALTKDGYGKIDIERRQRLAHRVSYELLVGEVPAGKVLDHQCRVKACIRPAHLEPVTQLENVRRGEAGQYQSRRTFCPSGHEYTAENTERRYGRRYCIACRRIRHRNRYPRSRVA